MNAGMCAITYQSPMNLSISTLSTSLSDLDCIAHPDKNKKNIKNLFKTFIYV
jgi:hypothetical protein